MAGVYGAPLQGNFSDALGNSLNDSRSGLYSVLTSNFYFRRDISSRSTVNTPMTVCGGLLIV